MSECDEFYISVAFIKMAGLKLLLQTLKSLEERGISGRILTTDYYSYSEPKALERLNSLKNVELRMYCVPGTAGFHTKGYIFRRDDLYHIVVGSSNITSRALTTNKEWNTKLVSTEKGEFARDLLAEFEAFWHSDRTINYEEYAESYEEKYRKGEERKQAVKIGEATLSDDYQLIPNQMQVEFISNLRKIRAAGESRAMLISSTGTGKTYAAAFAV